MTTLYNIIPSQVNESTEIYADLVSIASEKEINTILEIGASSGDGSTSALFKGIKDKENTRLFAIEVSKERFYNLKNKYFNYENVICLNVSTILKEEFPSDKDVEEFFLKHTNTRINMYSIDTILSWKKHDIQYIVDNNIPQNGIEYIKSNYNINNFDMVFIDGSEFTGEKELEKIWGAKVIVLDDIFTYKNLNSFNILSNSNEYDLIKQGDERHGYAIFRRKM